nr:HAMP domain-containing histidine kinase [Bacteroidales bacterium]
SIKLACSLDENPGEVTFSVTDTGPGVPAEHAEAIFDRFTKLNEFVQGSGLGLSICRDIATRMAGRVFLDTSYPGPGARFVFVLPLNPPANQ